MEMLEPLHPAAVQRRVGLIDIFSYRIHIKVRLEDGKLVWPVLFLYPEKGETDFIEEFRWFCLVTSWLYQSSSSVICTPSLHQYMTTALALASLMD